MLSQHSCSQRDSEGSLQRTHKDTTENVLFKCISTPERTALSYYSTGQVEMFLSFYFFSLVASVLGGTQDRNSSGWVGEKEFNTEDVNQTPLPKGGGAAGCWPRIMEEYVGERSLNFE